MPVTVFPDWDRRIESLPLPQPKSRIRSIPFSPDRIFRTPGWMRWRVQLATTRATERLRERLNERTRIARTLHLKLIDTEAVRQEMIQKGYGW